MNDPVVVAAIPMSFGSPSFYLLALTILAVAGIFLLIIRAVSQSGADSAPYDSARTLVNVALIMLSLVFLYVAGIVGYQVLTSPTGSATTEAWGQLCLFIGWVLGTATTIYNQRFGTTKASAEKDLVIAQQARTAAVTTDALLDPGVQVTGTGSGQLKAAIADTTAPTPAGAPLQADNVTINTVTTKVDQVDLKP